MTLLSPMFLWGLALLVPLVGVYLLKVRPRRHAVTAIFLWDEIFSQKKANALLQRLRDVLSLLILAFALVALVLAASRPRIGVQDDRDILLLIDRSISMAADLSDDNPGYSRFDAAIDRAEALVRAVGGHRRVAVATIDDRLDFATFLTDKPGRLRKTLEALTLGEVPSEEAPLDSIRQVAGLSDDLRFVALTDGVGWTPHKDDLNSTGGVSTLEVLLLGDSQNTGNLGLSAADLIASPDGQHVTLMFSATSSFSHSVSAEATLRAVGPNGDEGPVLMVLPFTAAPGHNAPRVTSIESGPGRYLLTLQRLDDNNQAEADALAADNQAYLSVPILRPLRVAVETRDRFFLETAVLAFARSSGLLSLASPDDPAELSIFRGQVGERSTNGRPAPALRVLFAPEQSGPAVAEVGQPLTEVLPRVLLPDHPVLRFLPAESMAFSGARYVEAVPNSAVLVADASGVPLIWQYRDPSAGKVTLVINLDPTSDDFVLSPYFPVSVYTAAADLGGRDATTYSTFSTGVSVAVPGLRPGDEASVRYADGTQQLIKDRQDVRLSHAGFHEVQAPAGNWDLAASVLHEAESRLEIPSEFASEQEVEIPAGFPAWFWFAIVGLVALITEEMLYHRRKVG